MQGVDLELPAPTCTVSIAIEGVADHRFSVSLGVQLIDQVDHFGWQRIQDNFSVFRLVAVGKRPVGFAVQRIFFQPPLCRSGKIFAVILRKPFHDGFHQSGFRGVIQRQGDSNDPHPVLFEPGLISCRIILVAAETVVRVNQERLKATLCAVLYHLLESRTLVCAAADGAVRIFLNY
nr:hypothetical protein [Faecalibaculum rodentium]